MYGNSAKLGAERESKQAVTVLVICDDAAAKKNIRESLLTHFYLLKDVEVVDERIQPVNRLCRKTINDDPKNPNGYAIAIAHTNTIPAVVCACANDIALTNVARTSSVKWCR